MIEIDVNEVFDGDVLEVRNGDSVELWEILRISNNCNAWCAIPGNMNGWINTQAEKNKIVRAYRKTDSGFWVKGYPYEDSSKTMHRENPTIHRFDTLKEADFFKGQIAHGELLLWGELEGKEECYGVAHQKARGTASVCS